MDITRVAGLLTDGCATYTVPGAQFGLLRGGERSVVHAGTRTVGDERRWIAKRPSMRGRSPSR